MTSLDLGTRARGIAGMILAALATSLLMVGASVSADQGAGARATGSQDGTSVHAHKLRTDAPAGGGRGAADRSESGDEQNQNENQNGDQASQNAGGPGVPPATPVPAPSAIGTTSPGEPERTETAPPGKTPPPTAIPSATPTPIETASPSRTPSPTAPPVSPEPSETPSVPPSPSETPVITPSAPPSKSPSPSGSQPAASIRALATVDARTATPGQTLTYRVRITNQGVTLAKSVEVTASLGAVARYGTVLSVSDGGTRRGDDIVWHLVLAPGATTELVYTVGLDASGWTSQSTPLQSRIVVPDGNCAAGTAAECVVDVIVTAAPKLVVDVGVATSANGPFRNQLSVPAGTTVWFSLRVRNDGTLDLTNPAVATSTFAGLAGLCPPMPAVLPPGASYECVFPEVAARSTLLSDVTVAASAGTVQTVAADAVSVVGVVTAAPSVRLSVGADRLQLPGIGGTVTYRYSLVNSGEVPLFEPAVTDTACAPLALVSGDSNGSGVLEPGEVWQYSCIARVNASTTSHVRAHARSGATTVSDAASLVVTVAPAVAAMDLRTRPDRTDLASTGGTVLFLYQLSNTGEAPLSDVRLRSALCTTITYRSGDRNANGILDVGETWSWDCRARITRSVDARVTASAVADGRRITAQASQFIAVAAPQPAIDLVVAASPVSLPATGGTVSYTYLVTNPGDSPLSRIAVVDDHCQPARFVAGDTNGNGTLDVGEVWSYNCLAALLTTTTSLATVTGTAGSAVARAVVSTTVPVSDAFPAIRVRATASPPSLPGRGTMAVNVSVTNHGNVPLANIRVADSLCPTMVGPIGDGNRNQVLDLSEVWTFVCDLSLTRTVTNTVNAWGEWRSTRVGNRDVTVLIVGDAQHASPRIGLDSLISPITLPAGGGDITVRYLVRNKGDAPLTGVTVTDDFCVEPAYLSGDLNRNLTLELTETWMFGCRAQVLTTRTSSARATGVFEGREVSETDLTTVAVTPAVPTPTPAPSTRAGGQTSSPSSQPGASSSAGAVGGPSGAPSPGAGEPPTVGPGLPIRPAPYPNPAAILLVALAGIAAAALIIRLTSPGRRA